jgi:hypothetical protein
MELRRDRHFGLISSALQKAQSICILDIAKLTEHISFGILPELLLIPPNTEAM